MQTHYPSFPELVALQELPDLCIFAEPALWQTWDFKYCFCVLNIFFEHFCRSAETRVLIVLTLILMSIPMHNTTIILNVVKLIGQGYSARLKLELIFKCDSICINPINSYQESDGKCSIRVLSLPHINSQLFPVQTDRQIL